MAASKITCHNCQRLIAPWVADAGVTLNHQGRDFCRFCYAELRSAGRVVPRGDDAGLLAAVNRELSEAPSKSGARRTAATSPSIVAGECPSCHAHFTVDLGPRATVEGSCPSCRTFLEIGKGKVKQLSVRKLMVRSISQRCGQPPELVGQMFDFFIDELAAQMAERPFMYFGELGNFRVQGLNRGAPVKPREVDVIFRPNRRLIERIVDRQKKTPRPK